MTEYGRSPGSEPWHPEDPLYGDGGWGGQEGHEPQSPYGGQPQHYPQQPQQPQYGDWGTGQQGGYDQGQQQYAQGQQQQQPYGQGQQQYGDQGPQQYNNQGGQGGQQYGNGQGGHQYGNGQGGQQYGNGQGGQQYGNGNGQGGQQYNGGWDTGQQQPQVPYGADPSGSYGNQPGAYGGQQHDYYGTPDAYPPPEPPSRRGAEPESRTDWDPGPDQGEHAFFAGGDDDDDDFDDDDSQGRRGKGGKGKKGKGGKKRRSGCACLVLTLVFVGGVGGVGYFGYQFYQDRFGEAPDYAGDGTSEQVTVTVPKNATGYAIGQALKDKDVVKSVDAFVTAQANNPKGDSIQPGVYTLSKEMSAKSAVALMLDPKSRNNLIIAEGRRNVEVYTLIDKRLELKKGTTAAVAKKEWDNLGLPEWANNGKDIKDPLEGFLYPSSYPVSKGMKPEDVLKEMVKQATVKYKEFGLESKAEALDLKNPLQLLTAASLVQVEGKYDHDFRKVARVVYNRLKPGNLETVGRLEFDSTINYIKGQSTLDLGPVSQLRQIKDPYNTYDIRGLPPGPISNPGKEAIEAAMKPTPGPWYYFVSINEDKTVFSVTNEEHNKNVEEYEKERN
ncbi:endolytic transglycosylase MltG [Streptomyces sp. 2A115]|uniref:endolytic transglycosylase MltG n=1 Tax=Streptomyces sp. 2A115 TaxID=3457439 RepID=UPI003FD3C6DC